MPRPTHPVPGLQKQAAAQANAVKLKNAVALHQRGQLPQAQALYQQILKSQPRHFDALQLLATIAAQQNDSAAAVMLFDQALAILPRHAGVLNNRGIALGDLKRLEEALQSYERALLLEPGYGEAWNNQGNVLLELKRPQQALASYDKALQLKPDHADAHNNRGNALRELKRPLEALHSIERALQIKPEHVEAWNNRGLALSDLQRHSEALDSYQAALQRQPNHADALYNQGNALRTMKRHEAALDSYDRALQIKPCHTEAHLSRGATLIDLQRPAEALECFEQALRIAPAHAGAHYNRGNALRDMHQLAPALACYEQALQIKPDYAEVHWNESLCRLQMGDFGRGWQKYEWRWKTEKGSQDARNFTPPLWLGQQALQDKTILLYNDQGFGDTIQFCRYVKDVAALGACVILEVPEPLKSLLRTMDGVASVLSQGERLPDFDYHCPLSSLPLAFQSDFSTISKLSYLQCDPQKGASWCARLDQNNKKRVGLAWSGSPQHKNDAERSIPLAQLHDNLHAIHNQHLNEQIDYYCLQKEVRPVDQAVLDQTGTIRFFGSELIDFSATAALIAALDLVITVDTSVAHLAGALGKEVWILLPFNPDWRWLLERTDSPWYGSARLFRQAAPGDWDSMLAQVGAALTTHVWD